MKINTGIDDNKRLAIVDGLSKLLADSYTLLVKTHNYHWNVMGPNFQSLHLLFEQQYNDLFTATDLIAERIRALGAPVPASFTQFAKLASIKESTTVPHAREMVKDLVESHETIRNVRTFLGAVEAGNDEATADALSGRLDVHEKSAWMLRAHLED